MTTPTEDEARAEAQEALSMLDTHPYLNHPVPPTWIKLGTREARVIQTALRDVLASRVPTPPSPCADHRPVQHRDARPPWCNACGLTASFQKPVGRLEEPATPLSEHPNEPSWNEGEKHADCYFGEHACDPPTTPPTDEDEAVMALARVMHADDVDKGRAFCTFEAMDAETQAWYLDNATAALAWFRRQAVTTPEEVRDAITHVLFLTGGESTAEEMTRELLAQFTVFPKGEV